MNENSHTVRLLLPESTAINLLGLLGNGMSSDACADLDLYELYDALHDAFGRTRLEGHSNIITRSEPNVSLTVERRDERPRYTSIDLT